MFRKYDWYIYFRSFLKKHGYLKSNIYNRIYDVDETDETKKSYELFLQTLKDFYFWSRKVGVDFYVLILPGLEQVVFEREKYLKEGKDFDRPYVLIREFLYENDIEFLDPTEIFKNSPDKKNLYFEKDRHLTVLGNRILADQLDIEIYENYFKEKY